MTAPVVTVRGEASREVDPDLATVSVSVGATGSSTEQVTAALATGSERIAATLGPFSDAIERSSTEGLNVYPVTDRRNPAKVTGYRGSFTAEVVVHDVSRLSDLLLAVAAVPQAELSGPWWSLRRDHPAHREVRLAAIADGRRRATDYAAAFGAALAELIEVSDLDGGFAAPMSRSKMDWVAQASAAEPSFDLEPKLQTVSGQVTLRFALSPVDLAGGGLADGDVVSVR